jgi:uncharacterized membrane protein YsdA (DUF1294 family)/cold shock CspA family protein
MSAIGGLVDIRGREQGAPSNVARPAPPSLRLHNLRWPNNMAPCEQRLKESWAPYQEKYMRFAGVLKSWNDARGFGFIEPDLGGEEVFVHVKACRFRGARPEVGQSVTFEVETQGDARGKSGKRAKNVELALAARRAASGKKQAPSRTSEGSSRRAPSGSRSGAVRWGGASYLAILLFGMLFLIAAVAWRLPLWVAGLYVGASTVTFLAYALDKAAARSGARRTAENTLLFFGLAGGWPGAIVAQQLLRHKSSKQSFRSAFWVTVVANIVLFLLLASPSGRALLIH